MFLEHKLLGKIVNNTDLSWTLLPIQEETYKWVCSFAFIPLFLFRMLSWLMIITMLDYFFLFVAAGFLLLNWIVFFLGQDHHEPLKQSLLSLVFPVIKLPSAKVNQQADIKLLAWFQSYKTFSLLVFDAPVKQGFKLHMAMSR